MKNILICISEPQCYVWEKIVLNITRNQPNINRYWNSFISGFGVLGLISLSVICMYTISNWIKVHWIIKKCLVEQKHFFMKYLSIVMNDS